MIFSDSDLVQLRELGISEQDINDQIEKFKSGTSYLEIIRAANLGHGIMSLNDNKIEKYIAKYEKCLPNKKLVKFVPASGAATRMFKNLFEFINSYRGNEEDYLNLLVDRSPNSVYYFFENIDQFAFFGDLRKHFFDKDLDLLELIEKREYIQILTGLLSEEGLNYGNLPKGLIKFHKYIDFSRSAAEEHLVEGNNYCKNSGNEIHIHFTVSIESLDTFKSHIQEVIPILEEKFNAKYHIVYSTQDPSTNIIAVDSENLPFRNDDGSLEFRPGGHGALIANVNKIDADAIFVKNIDNIVPDRQKSVTAIYKKTLAGILFSTQETIFKYLEILDEEEVTDDKLNTILKFIEKDLNILPASNFSDASKKSKIKYAKKKLNRPVRVCGMVINEGDPGGGPYQTRNADGTASLQIIEYSQINTLDEEQAALIENSTHFNPVDMVIGTVNYKGKKFNLNQYVDPNTGFVSGKSKNGKELKAYELPGLWNGAMSDWNTIFVEVPVGTFNPVKEVNDLLIEDHRTYEQ